MNKRTIIIITTLALVYVLAGIYLYPYLPDRMASHWNINGDVDGYMSKFFGVFLVPIISMVLFLVFLIIPKIDPLKSNIEKFRSYYDKFTLFIIIFLFYVHAFTILSVNYETPQHSFPHPPQKPSPCEGFHIHLDLSHIFRQKLLKREQKKEEKKYSYRCTHQHFSEVR